MTSLLLTTLLVSSIQITYAAGNKNPTEDEINQHPYPALYKLMLERNAKNIEKTAAPKADKNNFSSEAPQDAKPASQVKEEEPKNASLIK